GSEGHLALGLLNPVRESLGITHQLSVAAVVDALQRDARVVAERLTPEQRAELGTADPLTPEDIAMWADDDRAVAWAKEKQQQLNDRARWAMPVDLPQLAHEMRDD